jgi:hypothetical protein
MNGQENLIKEIMRKRKDNERDNLSLFLFHVKEIIGMNESDWFKKEKEIQEIKELNPNIQKVVINAKLRSMLMKFTSRTKKDVSDLLGYILDDADDTVWLDLLDRTILLYCKEHDVFKVTL